MRRATMIVMAAIVACALLWQQRSHSKEDSTTTQQGENRQWPIKLFAENTGDTLIYGVDALMPDPRQVIIDCIAYVDLLSVEDRLAPRWNVAGRSNAGPGRVTWRIDLAQAAMREKEKGIPIAAIVRLYARETGRRGPYSLVEEQFLDLRKEHVPQ